jgi:UDP-glucose 4-epimerase
MEVLITGVAGFIGSNLAKKFLENGILVYGIDNLSYGKMANIKEFLNDANFKFINGDLCNPLIYPNNKFDIVFHLASQKIPRYSSSLRTIDENSTMLKNIVNKCLIDKSRLIFASTSDVYGKNPDIPFSEESNLVLGPTTVKRWAYATSKIHAEHYILGCSEVYDLKYTITRFFGSYGPNQNLTWWGGPQSVFIQNAIEDREIELHGDGLQTRTFTFVDDTVNALYLCAKCDNTIGEILNVGSFPEEEISIKDLGQLIWKLVNGDKNEAKIKFIPYSAFGKYEDVRRRIPNINKLMKLTGYEPLFSLEEGLIKTINWQKNLKPQ